jgi:Na+/melibiose symporter-like transporter
MTAKGFRTRTCVAFGAPGFTEQLMIAPVWGILPALYAEHRAASLAAIGTVFMIARLFDAVSDPVIGYLSDITRSRFGPRKPWIAGGGLVSMIAIPFLYIPPQDAGTVYFFAWTSVLFVGWTMMVIPYNAWTTELTGDYQERARLFAYRNGILYTGALISSLAPILLFPLTGNTEFSLEFFRYLALALLVLIPVSIGIALYNVPQGESMAIERPTLRGIPQALRRNRVMWLFVAVSFLGALAQGMAGALEFLWMSNYLQLGPYVPLLFSLGVAISLGSIPLWYKLVERFGKHLPWAISSLVFALVSPLVFFVSPGLDSLPVLLFLITVWGFVKATSAVAAQSMLADIIDFDTLKTGVNRAGNYFSLLTLLSKGCLALGAGLGLALVGFFGYDPSTVNDDDAVFAFLAVFCLVPAVLMAINGLLILRYPLNERRQGIVRKRIEQLAERAQRASA